MRVLRRTWARWALVATACLTVPVLFAACEDAAAPPPPPPPPPPAPPPPPPPPGSPTLGFVTLSNDPDSAMAVVLTPMVIEVLDGSGQPLGGTPVRFASGPEAGAPPDPRAPFVLIGSVTGSPVDTVLETMTDATGRVGASLQLGPFAGAAVVRVTVPLHTLGDTVEFSILPAAPAIVEVTPGDTLITIGASYSFSASLADAYGNSIDQPIELQVLTPGTISIQDGEVRADAAGRGEFEARVGARADTGRVSVLPPGTIAMAANGPDCFSPSLAVIDTDGGNPLCLDTPMGGDRAPFWAPAGDRIVYHADVGGLRLHHVTLDGTITRLFTEDVGVSEELWPHYSRDGQWIYYTARIQDMGDASEIWRVRADGTEPQRVGPTVAGIDTHASPSPDGTLVAFATMRGGAFIFNIGVIEVATGNFTVYAAQGLTPRWSPRGDLIAFFSDGLIKTINPDGTGERTVVPDRFYDAGFDWSPDGEWLVASTGGQIELIEVASGATITLPFLGFQTTWRQ